MQLATSVSAQMVAMVEDAVTVAPGLPSRPAGGRSGSGAVGSGMASRPAYSAWSAKRTSSSSTPAALPQRPGPPRRNGPAGAVNDMGFS